MSDKISAIIDRYPEGEKRDKVAEAFLTDAISAEQLARMLKSSGFSVSPTTIKKYRRDMGGK